jgi:heme/copper-type cytochrome/quinol oxidase subunit 1
MASVTILGSEVVMTEHPLGLIFAIVGLIFLVISLIIGFTLKEKSLAPMIIFGVIGTVLTFGGMGWAKLNEVVDYTKYDVLVSEDANFQEFYNKYEILEAKGQIYTIKERSSK